MIQGLKKGKQLCSLFLSLCLLCSLFMTVQVAAVTSEDWDWEYEILEDETVEITGYNGIETKVEIPEMIDGKSVTSIGPEAFKRCSSITSIEIPSSVTNIRYEAFEECSSLSDIKIPSSVTKIGGVGI